MWAVASLLVLFAEAAAPASGPRGEDCTIELLQNFVPTNAKVLQANYVADNGSYGQGLADLSYPANGTFLPEMCAAIFNVTSSPTSSYTFGLYMPLEWENRFMEVGNGAFAGGINWLDMATASRYKMATVSTDGGHNSTQYDSAWALNNPDAQADWGWRAIHGSLLIGKLIAEGFYGSRIRYTYYMGASTGGRQGLRELEEFPDSYDGVIVGAPGWWTNHLQPWMTKVGIDNLPLNSSGHIRTEQFLPLAGQVVNQCDAVDGVVDGIVSSPEECKLDYQSLLCGESTNLNSTTCFTEDQVGRLKKIYGDYFTTDGEFVFPGFMISSEAQWEPLLGGSSPSPLGAGWVSDFLLNDPSWKWQEYNDSIVSIADKTDPGKANAGYFDLSRFYDAGGKLVMYQGLSDGGFSARSAQIFYQQVAQAMGYTTGADQSEGLNLGVAAKLQSWFKFYFVPGMQHCALSAVDAPWYINGPNQAAALSPSVYSVPGYEDPQHDIILAVLAWVEHGEDFGAIVGTAFHNQVPDDGILRQRPLCPFPMKQIYNGSGDPDVPSNWHCAYDGLPL